MPTANPFVEVAPMDCELFQMHSVLAVAKVDVWTSEFVNVYVVYPLGEYSRLIVSGLSVESLAQKKPSPRKQVDGAVVHPVPTALPIVLLLVSVRVCCASRAARGTSKNPLSQLHAPVMNLSTVSAEVHAGAPEVTAVRFARTITRSLNIAS
jgi:hypothetical protein